MTLTLIFAWLLTGLVIGGLARLLVPGRQHIGILFTLLIGIAGAVIGGVVIAALLGPGHAIVSFIAALVVAALGVSAFTGRGRARPRRRRRRW